MSHRWDQGTDPRDPSGWPLPAPRVEDTVADLVRSGKNFTVIADAEGASIRRVQQLVELAFLASDVIKAVRDGRQPGGLTSNWLRRLAYSPRGRKMQRLSLEAARCETGQLRLPKSAPWLHQFLTEAAEAPIGRYGDRPDLVSQMVPAPARIPLSLRGISRYKRHVLDCPV